MDKQQDAAPDYRERAIEIVAAELGCDAEILTRQMGMDPMMFCNNGEYKVLAVRETEKRLALEAEVARLTDLLAKETLRADDLRADLLAATKLGRTP